MIISILVYSGMITLSELPTVKMSQLYDESNQHFLFEHIQLGKGNTRGVRQATISIDGKQEAVIRLLHARE